jgi:hypothetical protein
MDKNHPLQYFLKKRKMREKDFDEFVDLTNSVAWFRGSIGANTQIDEVREAWEAIKKFLIFKNK